MTCSDQVKDCKMSIMLDKGTVSYPKGQEYQQMKIAGMEMNSSNDDESSDGKTSNDACSESEEEWEQDDDNSEESDNKESD